MRKVTLTFKLLLLIAFPLLLALAVGIYALRKFQADLLVVTFVILIVIYIPVAVAFIRRLGKNIGAIETVTADLANGNLNGKVATANLPEARNISESINLVMDDLHRKAAFAEQIKSGNLDVPFKARYENDPLGKALVSIKDNLIAIKKEDEQRNWASEGLAKFVTVLQSAKNLKALSNDIIINLVRILHANQGALFILSKDESDQQILEMQACYAFDRTKHLTQKISPGEGLIGQAFLERETVYLKDVPDRFVRITSGLGEANPRFVLIVPLKMNETIVGVVELASFKEFSTHEVAFVEKIGESIAHTFSSIQIAENTKKLLDESNAQAEQMRAQEEELRQNQEELQATQEAISRKYDVLFKQLGELNYQSRFDQLKSITSTKKRNIEYYFGIIRNQILTFSEDRMVVEAVNAFRSSFYSMGENLSEEEVNKRKEGLHKYYANEFIPKLNDNASRGAIADDYIPASTRALTFQYLFISNNPHPTGQKSLLDDGGDGSLYSKTHALYHPILRNFLEKFGYYDIFLIDAATGDMLYSVFKEVDFATNLFNGQYHTTNFGKVVKKVAEGTDKNFVQLIDFEPYDPSYYAPASFIACAVYDGDVKTGILVFQMPINKINQILTGNNRWREDGFGETGETVIVGDDYKLRSISRGLIEDTQVHLADLKKLRYSDTVLNQMRKMETNILLEEIKQESVTRALEGKTGTVVEENTFGQKTLSAFSPLDIPDVHWIIMSTMKEEEVSMRINSLRNENA
jgi:hypothetical protein